MLIYVDDIIVTGNNNERIEEVIRSLNKTFALRDLGDLNFFLGIQAEIVTPSYSLRLSTYKIY